MISLILTGTIACQNVDRLKLNNSEERLAQYESAIEFYVRSGAFDRIIFGENSDYFSLHEEDKVRIEKYATDSNVSFEIVSCKGDDEAVSKYGKGYGEGEMIKYIFDHCEDLAKDYVVKCTGRLKVDNIGKLVKKLKTDTVYFNVPNSHRREFFDTRLFAMPASVFAGHFVDAYLTVDDAGGHFLEHAYTETAKENGIRTRNFPIYPRITGISGSLGMEYSYSELKSRVKDILSSFNYYGKTD